jgi:hypothetical protein
MSLDKITFCHFEKIHNAGYTLDHVYLLIQIEKGIDVKALCEESPKLRALYQGIYRKGLINSNDNISLLGKEFISYMDGSEEIVKVPRKVKADAKGFESWWKAYPGTDTFTHKGVKFSGTRSLRAKKDDCKAKFDKIIAEGEYTVEDMISALEYEVLQKKENSIKTKTNKLSFMQNSLTYLNQCTFEPFIELVREGHKVIETTTVSGGTDI